MNNFKNINKNNLRAYREINLSNIEHNLFKIQSILSDGCKIMGVIKADAYGHGAIEVATHLESLGVEHFAVASLDEAIELRNANINGEILVLGYTPINRKKDLIYYDISQTIVDFSYAYMLCESDGQVKVHIKLDTGMNRLGTKKEDIEELINIYNGNKLKIMGTFSHLSRADSLLEEDIEFTKKQINRFYDIIDLLEKNNINLGKIHLQSSYGITNYRDLRCDLVRPGIILYGVSSSPCDNSIEYLNLEPALSLKSKVGLVKDIKKNETVGYGNNFTASKDSKIAIVTIGYADGYPRGLSKRNFKVLINGKEASVIGNICMDQMLVDVSHIDNINMGDTVTLIGKDGDKSISIDKISELTNTINNETLTGIGQRVCKVYI